MTDLADAKARLSGDPWVVAVFASPSNTGLKVTVWASGITDSATYRHAWGAVLAYFQQTYPDIAACNDKGCSDVARLCYMSWDPTAYLNPEPRLFVVPEYEPPPESPASSEEDCPDYATAASALPFVPGYDDYATWIKVGMALHTIGQPWAKPLWDSWSGQSPKYDAKVQQEKWRSFSTDRDHKVTMATVFQTASQHGWRRYTPNGTTSQGDETPIAPTPPWPVLDNAARYGLAGEIVTTLEPHTESDPVALLVQLLVMAGNCIGRFPYFTVEATRHHLNLFAALVGRSSRSRKGTSADHITHLLDAIDPTWSQCRASGLASGEGVIYHVRDAVYGQNRKGEHVCLDDGVDDKRLCVIESEFARCLSKVNQEGNVLSAVLRQAWDSGNLRTLVSGRQKAPTTATHAHVSVCSHITAEEVCRLLTDVEAGNGFGNRFLWCAVQRSKLLPSGGQYPHETLKPLIARLQKAVEKARKVAEIHRTPEAEPRWRELYIALAEERPGLLGALTARAEAQTMRLACLYALLDERSTVDVSHLNAAYALWRYCEESARFIFGDRLGDSLADGILQMLRSAGPEGMTRTAISNALGRHMKAALIAQALARLQRDGYARRTTRSTTGRSVEIWYATNAQTDAYRGKSEKSEKSLPPADLNSHNSLFPHTHTEMQSVDPAPPVGPALNGAAPETPHPEGYEELFI